MFSGVPSPMEETGNSLGPSALKSFQDRRKGFEPPNNTPPGLTPKKPAVPKPALGSKAPANEVKPSFVKPVGGINRTAFSPNANSQAKDEKNTFPKPSAFKLPSQQTEEPKAPFLKPVAGKPFAPQEAKFSGLKPTFPPEPKGIEEKTAFPKPSQLKSVNSNSETEVRPPFQKKPPFGVVKPPVNVSGSPSENSFNKQNLVTRTFSNSQDNKPIKPTKESTDENISASPSSQPFHGVPLRPTGIKQLQSPFLNKSTDEPSNSPKSSFKDSQMKANQNGNSSSPFGLKHHGISNAQGNLREPKDPNEPKRKPLPSPAKLGPPPQKPARPPNVDIERFRAGKGGGGKVPVSEQKSSALSSALPPPPPIKSPQGPSSLPSLPPRNIKLPEPIMPDEDNYDDVEGPSINDISEESDEEVYDELDEPRKEQEKNEKKKKKELEQAKKEQKEKERKEQEIRKKFKLTDKIDVLHRAKASVDHKGGKNELSFKNGDQIEIIRVTDNPEGKWLGRMNGTYGYIKTTMVNVDYDSLRRRKTVTLPKLVKPDPDQEIYDDVGEDEATSNSSGHSYFPPPPSNDDDIYDGVDEEPLDSSVLQEEEKSGGWSWFKKRKGTQHKQKNEPEDSEESEFALSHSSITDSDVYDDVETDFPPPPLESSLFTNKRTDTLGRSPDYKTLKKLEKEEKEFRKKFKFTGDIRVLSTVQVVLNLSTKKWGSKDLSLKAGEALDVIQHTSDSMLLCKNSEGKYGYVLRSNIIDTDDGEVYDDIGGDCIYDND
ncbi:FYN-binding protein 1 [Mantella aurantiaca]